MEGMTMRSGIVTAGVGNLCSLGEDRLACASHTSQVGVVRQLSASSSLSALRFLGQSNVTSFLDAAADQAHRCSRRSGSSISSRSTVCLAKSDRTGETERPDGSPSLLSAIAMPILAAVMVGAVQPGVQAVEKNEFALEQDRFAAPGGGGQFSAPSAGGLQPKADSKSSAPSKGKEAVESVTPQLPSNPLKDLQAPQLPSNPFEGLLPGGKNGSSAKNTPGPVSFSLTPVATLAARVPADGAPITESSPFLKSGTSYKPPATPESPVKDEPPAPGTPPIDQREGPVQNVTKTEAGAVQEATGGNATSNK